MNPSDATPTRVPDPGSRSAAAVAWIVLLVAIGLVMWLQQAGGHSSSPARGAAGTPASTGPPGAPGTPATPPTAPEPDAQFDLSARVIVKLWYATAPKAQAAAPSAPSAEAELRSMLENLDTLAASPWDRARVILIAQDSGGDPAARPRLDKLRSADPPAELLADLALLDRFISGSANDTDRTELTRRYGWYGTLLAGPEAERDKVIAGGVTLILLALGFGIGAFALIILGVVLFVLGIARYSSGRLVPAFTRPAPGGSVYLETAAVFALGFLSLKLVSIAGAALGVDAMALQWLALIAQWLLLLAALWPLVRGVEASTHWRLIGLHRGRGVLREIGAGIVGYLAGLPLLLGALALAVIIVILQSLLQPIGAPAAPPSNPMIDLVAGAPSPLVLVMFFLLAAVWAPLCEETIFRGALYRHLRGRVPVLAAAALSGAAFAIMHGYPWMMLIPVAALGLNFALMREWRDSLIAPITAHALHNATLLGLMMVVIRTML